MLRSFHTSNFGAFLINFERCCAFTEFLLNPPPILLNRDRELMESIPRYRDALQGLIDGCNDSAISLSLPVKMQIERLYDRLGAVQPQDFANLAENARIVRQALLDDLSRHLFFYIPDEYRHLMEQSNRAFGDKVEVVFTDAKRDIEAAARCLALNEWTACVFHLMRVLEHGLRPMARHFNVSFDISSWHQVIQGIENGIAGLRNKQGLQASDRDEITYYSQAASQFRYFKDAWRNHVSHSREHYDERDAWQIFTHVREFMQHIAEP